MIKCCGENGEGRSTRCKVAKNLQSVKSTTSAKYNKVRYDYQLKVMMRTNYFCVCPIVLF